MPDPDPPPSPTPACRRAPPEVWERVRDDYLAGVSAPECCRLHGVGLSALRDRAAREGWRRADQPWVAPGRLDPDDEGVRLEAQIEGDLDRVGPAQLAFVADRRMMRAVLRGDAAGALRWSRVARRLNEEQAELDRWIAQEESLRHRMRDPDDPDDSDDLDGVFPSGPSDPD
ncbi:hypothetical protein Q0812_05550 [Brevundimonas sp. 2R-24]|uniref:Terminase small subunit n=1 Tax=Peiella sedimenti TaxID=3061083 RepID=A0ABT8SLN2_9CAUL|nr:hypothetical protein [Caulobacteraceae bacterium XZ-24]